MNFEKNLIDVSNSQKSYIKTKNSLWKSERTPSLPINVGIFQNFENAKSKNSMIRLNEKVNKVKEQLKKIAKPFENSQTTKNFQDIIDFKRKKGLFRLDTHHRFKENLKVFKIVETFVDISEKMQKASQYRNANGFFSKKNPNDQRNTQIENPNHFVERRYDDILEDKRQIRTEAEDNTGHEDNNNNNNNAYLMDLLDRANKHIDEVSHHQHQYQYQQQEDQEQEYQLQKEKNIDGIMQNKHPNESELQGSGKKDPIVSLETSITDEANPNHPHPNNTLNNEMTLNGSFSIGNDQKDKGKKQVFVNMEISHKNLKTEKNLDFLSEVHEHLKNDNYKFPLIFDDENQFEFYEKLEKGKIFKEYSPKRTHGFMNPNNRNNKNKLTNSCNCNFIRQDPQYVLINNLENFTINSRKLVNNVHRKSLMIYNTNNKRSSISNPCNTNLPALCKHGNLLPSIIDTNLIKNLFDKSNNHVKNVQYDSNDKKPKKSTPSDELKFLDSLPSREFLDTQIGIQSTMSTLTVTKSQQNLEESNSISKSKKESVHSDIIAALSTNYKNYTKLSLKSNNKCFNSYYSKEKSTERHNNQSSNFKTESDCRESSEYFNTFNNIKIPYYDHEKRTPNSPSIFFEGSSPSKRSLIGNSKLNEKLIQNKQLCLLKSNVNSNLNTIESLSSTFSPQSLIPSITSKALNIRKLHKGNNGGYQDDFQGDKQSLNHIFKNASKGVYKTNDSPELTIRKRNRLYNTNKELQTLNHLIQDINEITKQNKLDMKEYTSTQNQLNSNLHKNLKNIEQNDQAIYKNINPKPTNKDLNKRNLMKLQKLLCNNTYDD